MDEMEEGLSPAPPIWAIFGDLMSGLVGAFVLLLVWLLGYQLELAQSLHEEIQKRQVEEQLRMAEEQRRIALENALADPLAAGRVTLHDGRIVISGNVLFSLNSDQLQPEGQQLLKTLVAPLRVYLGDRKELLMVSGFTDDLPIQEGSDP